jgi:formate dehydrogenase major subunit
VWQELMSLAPSLQGLSYASLVGPGRLWPADEDILFGDTFPSGRGKLVPAEVRQPAELPDADYPLILITGRLLEHWHTGSMTRRSKALDEIEPEPFIELHPADAARVGVAAGDYVVARTRRGSIRLRCRLSDASAAGSCFIPFHFREAAANLLTIDELDPFGKIPEFKYCAVAVERG